MAFGSPFCKVSAKIFVPKLSFATTFRKRSFQFLLSFCGTSQPWDVHCYQAVNERLRVPVRTPRLGDGLAANVNYFCLSTDDIPTQERQTIAQYPSPLIARAGA